MEMAGRPSAAAKTAALALQLLLLACVVGTVTTTSGATPVIDAHVHMVSESNGLDYLWATPPQKLSPPRACPCAPPCMCNWTQSEYSAASASLKPSHVIFCEVDVNTTQWLREAKWAQRYAATLLSSGGPQIGAILAQPPPGFGTQPVGTYTKQLDELQQLPLVRGLRPQIPTAMNSSFVEAMQEAGRRGLVIDINHGYKAPAAQRETEAGDANGVVAAIVAAAPNTTFVIEHLWGAPGIGAAAPEAAVVGWKAGLKALALHPNIRCLQIGGVMAGWGHTAPYTVNKTVVIDRIHAGIEAFGYDRVCFGARPKTPAACLLRLHLSRRHSEIRSALRWG
jgi:predicted TIM-barrel fold metal-dependent hydrolase